MAWEDQSLRWRDWYEVVMQGKLCMCVAQRWSVCVYVIGRVCVWHSGGVLCACVRVCDMPSVHACRCAAQR